MEKGGLRGRDRTRRIAIDFGRKLAEVDRRRSSRAESGVTIDRLLSCFRSSRNGACKTDEQCKSNGRKLFLRRRDEMARWMRRSLKTGGKIQALRVSEARRWRREYGASMEMAFFECTHCSFLTGSRLSNEGKGVARGGDPASVAAYVLQRSRKGWLRNGRLHIQDMRLTSFLRKRQVEELHQEEPTPVASWCSTPRKLQWASQIETSTDLSLNPNHGGNAKNGADGFFSHFTVCMYLRGGRGGRWGFKYEASRSATGNRRPTSNIFTCDPWRSERPSQRHKPSPKHDLLGMSSAKRKLIMCIQKWYPPQVNSNGQHETTTRTSSGRCKLF